MVFQPGDLVYSFADETFYVILSTEGSMAFEVYNMHGQTCFIIDVTLVHINNLEINQCENDNKIYYNKNKNKQ